MLLSEQSVRENIFTWRHNVIDVMVTSPLDSLLWLANRILNTIYASILHQLQRRYHNLYILYQYKSFAANFPWSQLAFLFLYHNFRRPLPYKFLQLALHKNMSGSYMTKSKLFHWVKLVRGKTILSWRTTYYHVLATNNHVVHLLLQPNLSKSHLYK